MLDIKYKEFPTDIRDKIKTGVRKNKIEIKFNSGVEVMFSDSNIKVTKPHNIIFKDTKKKRYMIAFIVENEAKPNDKPKIYLNFIHKKTACSITYLIETVNKTFFPPPQKRS